MVGDTTEPWGLRFFPPPRLAIGTSDRCAAAVIAFPEVYRLLVRTGGLGGWQFRFYDGARHLAEARPPCDTVIFDLLDELAVLADAFDGKIPYRQVLIVGPDEETFADEAGKCGATMVLTVPASYLTRRKPLYFEGI